MTFAHLDAADQERIEAYAEARAEKWLDRAIDRVTDIPSVAILRDLRGQCIDKRRGHQDVYRALVTGSGTVPCAGPCGCSWAPDEMVDVGGVEAVMMCLACADGHADEVDDAAAEE